MTDHRDQAERLLRQVEGRSNSDSGWLIVAVTALTHAVLELSEPKADVEPRRLKVGQITLLRGEAVRINANGQVIPL